MSEEEFEERLDIDPLWLSATGVKWRDHPGAIVAYANPDRYSMEFRNSKIRNGIEQAVILGPSPEFPKTEVEVTFVSPLYWIRQKNSC
jgi:hypothetical protein